MYGMPQPNSYGQYGYAGYAGSPGGAAPGMGSPVMPNAAMIGGQAPVDPQVASQAAQAQWAGADPSSYYSNYWGGEHSSFWSLVYAPSAHASSYRLLWPATRRLARRSGPGLTLFTERTLDPGCSIINLCFVKVCYYDFAGSVHCTNEACRPFHPHHCSSWVSSSQASRPGSRPIIRIAQKLVSVVSACAPLPFSLVCERVQ